MMCKVEDIMKTAKNDDVLTILTSATLSLSAAFTVWCDLEDRIFKGQAYLQQRPDDARAVALLAELEGKAATARGRYEEAEHLYKIATINEEVVNA